MKLLILKAILTLLPLAPPHWHESQAEYETRARTMAIAIAEESRTRAEAMMVVTVFRWESSFAPDVHSGERLGDGGRAICAGQHHRNGRSEAEWRALAGTGLDATRRCVRATVRALRGSAHYCRRFGHTEPVNAFVKYGSGRRCLADRTTRPGDFRRRARTFARLMRIQVLPPLSSNELQRPATSRRGILQPPKRWLALSRLVSTQVRWSDADASRELSLRQAGSFAHGY